MSFLDLEQQVFFPDEPSAFAGRAVMDAPSKKAFHITHEYLSHSSSTSIAYHSSAPDSIFDTQSHSSSMANIDNLPAFEVDSTDLKVVSLLTKVLHDSFGMHFNGIAALLGRQRQLICALQTREDLDDFSRHNCVAQQISTHQVSALLHLFGQSSLRNLTLEDFCDVCTEIGLDCALDRALKEEIYHLLSVKDSCFWVGFISFWYSSLLQENNTNCVNPSENDTTMQLKTRIVYFLAIIEQITEFIGDILAGTRKAAYYWDNGTKQWLAVNIKAVHFSNQKLDIEIVNNPTAMITIDEFCPQLSPLAGCASLSIAEGGLSLAKVHSVPLLNEEGILQQCPLPTNTITADHDNDPDILIIEQPSSPNDNTPPQTLDKDGVPQLDWWYTNTTYKGALGHLTLEQLFYGVIRGRINKTTMIWNPVFGEQWYQFGQLQDLIVMFQRHIYLSCVQLKRERAVKKAVRKRQRQQRRFVTATTTAAAQPMASQRNPPISMMRDMSLDTSLSAITPSEFYNSASPIVKNNNANPNRKVCGSAKVAIDLTQQSSVSPQPSSIHHSSKVVRGTLVSVHRSFQS